MRKITPIVLISTLLLTTGCVPREPKATTTLQVNTNPDPIYVPQEIIVIPEQPRFVPQNPRVQQLIPSQPISVSPPYTLPPQIETQPIAPTYQVPQSRYLGGHYGRNYKLKKFINMMVSKHHYNRYQLNAIFSTVRRDEKALEKYNVFKTSKPTYSKATKIGAWDKYRSNFLTSERINKGVIFWRENEHWLRKAYQQYGVAPEYIVGIIGVETNFGGYTGKHSVMNALTTLALEFKKRSKFFTGELESYLLMIREEKINPQWIKGSYAGAFGLAQFMPTAFRQHSIDFNQDGHTNLFNSADAIGSIAKYFVERGKWKNRLPVTMKTYYNKKRFYGLATGFKSGYSQRRLRSLGMRPSSNFNGYKGNVSLIKLSRRTRDELWWGTKNFYAITRYNPKDHYAMAVHQLAQAIKKAKYGR